jgi:group II intron reverse transcriptase/maturase
MHQTIDSRKAVGVDGVQKEEYGKKLEENIDCLVKKLKQDSYQPKPSRRVRIPKPGSKGKTRPLGISCYEDKLVESAVSRLLTAVYEPKFLDVSYGFRPERNCHQAISAMREAIAIKKINYVVEVDIKSYFDTMDHDWLIKFLEHDIADKKLIRLIKKFLKAGVMENGEVIDKTEGSPQGNIMSPVLANVYLHYVLDLWFEKVVKKQVNGESYMVRYADDFVCLFQFENEAYWFLRILKARLKKFSLEVSEEKTRVLEFGKYAKERRVKRGLGKPETFNFLGFTFCCGKAKFSDEFCLFMHTDRKKFSDKLKKLRIWLKANRTLPIDELMYAINKSLIGYYNYYGVPTNLKRLDEFRKRIEETIFKVLNKRSQKRSFTWDEFNRIVLERYPLIRPRIRVYV